jgi:hypothetical protein
LCSDALREVPPHLREDRSGRKSDLGRMGEEAVTGYCRYFVSDFLEGCRKTMENVDTGNLSPGRHLI